MAIPRTEGGGSSTTRTRETKRTEEDRTRTGSSTSTTSNDSNTSDTQVRALRGDGPIPVRRDPTTTNGGGTTNTNGVRTTPAGFTTPDGFNNNGRPDRNLGIVPPQQPIPFRARATTASPSNNLFRESFTEIEVVRGGRTAAVAEPTVAYALDPGTEGGGTSPTDQSGTTPGERHLAEAEARSNELWDQLPPDTVSTYVPPEGFAQAWSDRTSRLVGPGNPEAQQEAFEDNREQLDALGRIAGGTNERVHYTDIEDQGDQEAFADQLYAPVLGALQEEYPDAKLRLVAVEDGTIPPRPGTLVPTDRQIAIEMERNGEIQHFFLNPSVLDIQGEEGSLGTQLRNNPELAESWYNSARSSGALPEAGDAGNAQETLERVERFQANGILLDSVLGMPRDQQIDLIRNLGNGSTVEGDPERLFGGLLISDQVAGEPIDRNSILASVDATPIANGERPTNLNATFNVAAVNGLDKNKNFVGENYDALVDPLFSRYATVRGDEPRELSGTDIENEIGAAMNLTPNNVPDTDEEWAQLERGEWNMYTGDQAELIAPIADQIRSTGGEPARVTALPIMYRSEDNELVQLPLFRVESGGQTRFVDNTGRRYDNFEDWKDNNELPAGTVTYPRDGHLSLDANGRPQTVTEDTHAVVDTVGEHITSILDKAALVGGFVVAGAAIIGTGGAALPVAAGAIAAWGAYRSGSELVDRAQHGQSINPLEDRDARNAWFGFGANVAGLAALGAGPLARALGTRVPGLASGANSAANATRVAAFATDSAAILNTGVDLVQNWDQIPGDQRLLAISQMAFWGGVNVQSARGGRYSAENVRSQLDDQLNDFGVTQNIRNLPEGVREATLRELSVHAGSPATRDAILALHDNPRFRALSEADQIAFLREAIRHTPVLREMDPQYRGEETGSVWGTSVRYLDEAGRAPYEVRFENGVAVDGNGRPIDTSGSSSVFGSGRMIFVLSPDGRMYASADQAIGEFHHSSFLSGGDVAGAGEITVQNGRITEVSDQSGHYRPTQTQVWQTLDYLRRNGVDLSTVQYRNWSGTTVNAEQFYFDYGLQLANPPPRPTRGPF